MTEAEKSEKKLHPFYVDANRYESAKSALTGAEIPDFEAHQNFVTPRPNTVVRRPAAKAAFLLKYDHILRTWFRCYC